MTISETLEFALRLPEVAEQAHHGILSLRVGGRIFATVPDDTHLRVMVDESAIRAFVAAHPGVCTELWWGKRLACVVVDLPSAPRVLVEELLVEAWAHKAHKGQPRPS